MQISFHDIIPAPLEGVVHVQSEIWNAQPIFEQGKLYQIYAPSGKGKSTFTHIIYGIRNDYRGSAKIDQKDTQTFSANQWAKLRQEHLSIVFQDLRLFLNLTAWENLQVKAVLNPAITEKEIEEMMEQVGILALKNKKAALLSYGERQRVAILRSLLQPFSFILLDEPFSHLDEANIQKASELISKKVKENKAGMLLTSLGQDYFFNYDHKLLLG